MKSNFKKCCKNYFIKDDNLYYKKTSKFKNKDRKWESKKIDILVPKVDELNKLLFKFHVDSCHSNYKELKNLFYQNNIGFIGMDQLLEEYVRNCPLCCQTSRDLIRKDPIKSLEVEGPDARYAFDITYLNVDMSKAFGIKYLLSILDCFSRKANIYGTNTKNADLLLKYVADFCLNNKIPKKFINDNGMAFKNRVFTEFCESHNIKFLHGAPYSPHTHGIVQRFNYTIKKYLCKDFFTNNRNNLIFENIKFKIVNFYNNKKHRILGMSPLDAHKITEPLKIKELNEKKNKIIC